MRASGSFHANVDRPTPVTVGDLVTRRLQLGEGSLGLVIGSRMQWDDALEWLVMWSDSTGRDVASWHIAVTLTKVST